MKSRSDSKPGPSETAAKSGCVALAKKGVLAFLAQDAEQRVFCYAQGRDRKADQADEILRFVEFWHERTGRLPAELVLNSKLTILCERARV